MKIIHFSDTHLGYSDYSKFDSISGINQRELDTYNAFREIVDYILKIKPDLVLHAGDLFDNIRPPNRAISEALEQFFRLSKANIPTVVIAGNHEAPRQKSAETIFKILKYFPNIYPVFNGHYEKLEIGKCAIHVIPHTYSDEDLQESVKKLKPDNKFEYNIMVAHTAIRGVQEASWGEYKEQTLPSDVLTSEFNYIALGHYHRFLKVKDNAYYCGSPERFSFNEVRDKKGFLEVELDNFSVNQITINARNMIVFDPINCSDLIASEIVQKLQSQLNGNVNGNIVKVIFDNIPRHVHSSLDFQKIREIVGGAIHYEPVYNWKLESGATSTTSQIGTLHEEFETYLNKLNLPELELIEIKTLGLEYLGKVREEVSID